MCKVGSIGQPRQINAVAIDVVLTDPVGPQRVEDNEIVSGQGGKTSPVLVLRLGIDQHKAGLFCQRIEL